MDFQKTGKTIIPASLILAVTVFILIAGYHYLYDEGSFLLPAAFISLLVFLLSIFIFQVAAHKYFTGNLSIIRKNVLRLVSKSVPPALNEKSPRELFDEVNRLLLESSQQDKDEIVHLKELEEFRKEFLGNVSHELKTPIFTIQGYLHTLIEGGIGDPDVNMLYLNKAAKSLDRLISIVDDLESISRLETGGMILENRTFDLRELIVDVIESLELRAKEKSIRIRILEDDAKHCYVYADKDRIRQVLVNLLVNSIKYGKKGGLTTISINDTNDPVRVIVSDDGIGMESMHLPRIFERFYRVDKSRSREQGGTGLGLAIVKHLVEAHQQKISVESIPGQGTTFTFTLSKSN